MHYRPKLFQDSPHRYCYCVVIVVVVGGVTVMVELLLRNLLMTMWCFSDCNVSCSCCDPFDVDAAVVFIIIFVVLLLQVQ